MKKTVNYAQDKLYHLVVALFVNATILVDFVRYFATAVWEPVRFLATPLRNVLYIGCGLYVAYLFFRYGFDWIDLTVLCASVAAWGASYLINPAISAFWLDPVITYFSRVLVAFILFRHMENYEKLAGIMVWFFPVILVYAILGFFQTAHIYMTLSYNLMPQALFFLFWGLRRKNRLLEICGMSLFFIATFLGCRGALLGGFVSIFLCLVVMLICGEKKDFLRALIHIAVGAAVMLLIHWILTIDFSKIVIPDWLISMMSSNDPEIVAEGGQVTLDKLPGFASFNETTKEIVSKSRNTKMIQKGTMNADSNRLAIYGRVIAAIKEQPFLPNGLLADRFKVPTVATPAAKHYAHNIVLEICYQWGIPLGLCLIAGIVVLFVRKAAKIRKMDKSQLVFMLTFIPMTAVQLMVSYSYLISWLFGICMGLLASKTIEKTQEEPVPALEAASSENTEIPSAETDAPETHAEEPAEKAEE